MQIEKLNKKHLTKEFVETLNSLSHTSLTKEELKTIFKARLCCKTFVAVIDDIVVGTATLLIETKFIHNGGKVGHIEDVATHSEFRNKGIGRALVLHCEEIARKNGCYKVILDCSVENMEFYKKLGFFPAANQMRKNINTHPK